MFVFPVMYEHDEDSVKHLVSYIPVLYLNSTLGVIGGLTFGMRKEYKPNMVADEYTNGKSWQIPDLIYGHFVQDVTHEATQELPHFYQQMFDNPQMTYSYTFQYYVYNAKLDLKEVLPQN